MIRIALRSLGSGLTCALLACASSSPSGGTSYENDATYRRSELLASLVNPSNTYSQLRLAHYDSGNAGDWSRLPEWNPPTEPIAPGELDATAGVSMTAALTPAASARDAGDADLLALGEDAFFHYPAQMVPSVGIALTSRAAAEKYGLWIDDARGVGGLVHVDLGDGARGVAWTCATCHVRATSSGLIVGDGNASFNFGQMISDAASARGLDASAWAAWGPGRVDVTTAVGSAPIRIPDLRPVRWLTHLHQEATVKQNDIDSLAIRLETLLITSSGETVRPPRRIVLALATYIWSLSSSVAPQDPTTESERDGAAVFQRECARCHQGDAMTGPPVALVDVGTDPAIGMSTDRGTGMYRVPSLLGAGSRGMLLHDASLGSIAAILDPSRTSAGYTGGRRSGEVAGHTFGFDLDDAARAALINYLQSR